MEEKSRLDIYRVEKTKLKLSYLLSNTQQVINIYLCIPKNQISINNEQVEENTWLQHSLIAKRRYFGKNLTLDAFTTLLSKALTANTLAKSNIHRAALNALWHQYRLALTHEIKNLKALEHIKNLDDFSQSLLSIQQCFENHDNQESIYVNDLEDIINWYSLQSLQRFMLFIGGSEDLRLTPFTEELQRTIDRLYRRRIKLGLVTPYTSKELSQFLEALSLKKKIMHFTDILKESVVTINYRYQIAVLGVSAAVAMLVLYFLLVKLGGSDEETTIPILIAIACGYGVREIFKESIKKNLGNFYKQHFFTWKRTIKNAANLKHLATQWIAIRWLNTRIQKKIDSLNLQNYKILHYKSLCKLNKKSLPEGYQGIEESLTIDFAPFASQLLPGTNPILIPKQDNKGLREIGALFKCYLIVSLTNDLHNYHLIEFHINKDRIINLRVS